VRTSLPVLLTAIALILCETPALSQSFSCSFGEPACLDFGAIVCESNAKCVGRSDVCFDSYTCDYKGFICKSKFDDVVAEYDSMLNKHNDLVNKYNALANSARSLAIDNDTLKSEIADLSSANERMKQCVLNAVDLDEAVGCAS
jgi:hypothetical protein